MAGEGALAVVRTVMVATVAARVVEVAWLEFHQGLAVETTGEEAVMTAARVARVVLGEEVAGEMVGEAEMLACLCRRRRGREAWCDRSLQLTVRAHRWHGPLCMLHDDTRAKSGILTQEVCERHDGHAALCVDFDVLAAVPRIGMACHSRPHGRLRHWPRTE
eukprot:6203492-Pleurochrysis_carterae.AAC.1